MLGTSPDTMNESEVRESPLLGGAELAQRLIELRTLDLEAARALDNAVAAVRAHRPDLVTGLERLREGHEASASILEKLIAREGAEPPSVEHVFPGYLIGGMFALREEVGAEGVLRALCTNETLLTATFEASLYWPIDDETRICLESLSFNEQSRKEAVMGLLARAKISPLRQSRAHVRPIRS